MSALRLILTSSYVVKAAALGCMFSCGGEDCLEYTGTVPAGYSSIEDWYAKESGNLHCWSAQTYTTAAGTTAINLKRNSNTPATEIGLRETLDLTVNDASLATIDSSSVYYYPEEGMVFARVSVTLVTALAKGSTRKVAVVSSRHPAFVHALAVAGTGLASGSVNTEGSVFLRAHEAITAGTTLRLTGWWVVAADNK